MSLLHFAVAVAVLPLAAATGTQPQPAKPAFEVASVKANIHGGAIEISQLVSSLGAMMRETVMDRTGLTGKFDVELKGSLEGFLPVGNAAGGPSQRDWRTANRWDRERAAGR
jgi:uncharacterized protein (TIGR03435 family)